MAATDLGYYARSPYGLFPYTAPLALDQLGIQVSMLGLITRALGIEVEHTRYNTGLLRILWEIASDGITTNNILASSSITFYISSANASSGAVYTNNSQEFTVISDITDGTILYTNAKTKGNPAASGTLTKVSGTGDTTINFTSYASGRSVDKSVLNLKSDITEQYWETNGLSDEWFVFDVGENKTLAIDTLAFIDTNLTTSAVIKLKGSGAGNSAPPSDWDVVPFIQMGVSGSIDPNALINPTDSLERNRIWVSPTLPTNAYRYFKVSIVDTTNTNGRIKVGRFVAGKGLIFTTENCLDVVTYKVENYKDEFKINGFTSIANNRAYKKQMTLTFKNLNRYQFVNYKRLMQYCEYCRDTLKALVFVDPNDTYQFTVFSKLKEMPSQTHNYISNDTSNVELVLTYDEAR